jgi:hypothetical protein
MALIEDHECSETAIPMPGIKSARLADNRSWHSLPESRTSSWERTDARPVPQAGRQPKRRTAMPLTAAATVRCMYKQVSSYVAA